MHTSRKKRILGMGIAMLMPIILATHLPSEATEMTAQQTESSLPIPSPYVLSNSRDVMVDGEPAILRRYERTDNRNKMIGGEHFSTIISKDGRLKGFANMSLDLTARPLPSREQSEQIARAFLEEYAPDLLPRMEISWIEPHDEPLQVLRDGKAVEVTLTGLKVKARNLADGRWFWVIVGPDSKPMVFERDIVWVSFPGHRKTEKWLHDTWLADHPEHGA
ncbi:MAG: hypothetical protein Q4E06_09630 [Lautropia sp.]|nr:hypothetical protein [Lautropia sp.]